MALRLVDILFVLQKENFVRCNYEVRLRSRAFDDSEHRYRYTFSFEQLEQWIGGDMLEHPHALLQTLLATFEPFLEDAESFKKLVDSEIAKRKLAEKAEDDGTGGAGGDEQVPQDEKGAAQEEQQEAAGGAENAANNGEQGAVGDEAALEKAPEEGGALAAEAVQQVT